jgi:carbonic anhydrase
MLTFTTPQLRDIVKKAHPGDAVVAEQVDAIDFQEFPQLEERVKADVEFLQKNPMVLEETKISGWVYSVETGKVNGLGMRNKSKYSCKDVVQITQIA